MPRKHIPLTIVRPGVEELYKIDFKANAKDQQNIIPFRYPFADISNYQSLKDKDFFRHATTHVDESLGGNSDTNARTTLGYKLPRTEKLILVCKVTSALGSGNNVTITVRGSKQYQIEDIHYKITQNLSSNSDADLQVSANDVFEIDLYNFGLLIDSEGEIVIETTSADAEADKAKVSFGLVARTG